MKEYIQHPIYGKIIYNENAWTGKKTITVNGVTAQAISKKDFIIEGQRATVKGSYLSGAKLLINGEAIQLTPSPKWYEYFLAALPIAFLLTWGNSVALCSIFPVVGGAMGGAIGGLSSVISLILMKRSRSVTYKILLGLATFAASVALAFIIAIVLIQAIVQQ